MTEKELNSVLEDTEKVLSLENLRISGFENSGKYLSKNAYRKLAKENGLTIPERVCSKLSPIVFSRKKSTDGKRYSVSSCNPLQEHSILLFQDGFEMERTNVTADISMNVRRDNGVDILPQDFRVSTRKSTRISSFEEEKFLTYSNCISRTEKMADFCQTCRLKYSRYVADKYRMGLFEFDRQHGGQTQTYLITLTLANAFKSGFETSEGNWISDYRLLSARLTNEVLTPLRKKLAKYGIECIYMFCREIGKQGRLHFHLAITLSHTLYGYCARRKLDPVTTFNKDEIVVPTAKDFYDEVLCNTGWSECEFRDDTPRVARQNKAKLKKFEFDLRQGTFVTKPLGNTDQFWTWDEWSLAYLLYGYWRYGIIDVQVCADKYASSAYVVKYVLKDAFESDGKPCVTFSRGILTPVFERYKDKLAKAERIEDLAIPTGYYQGKATYAYTFPQYYRERYVNYAYRKQQTDEKVLNHIF